MYVSKGKRKDDGPNMELSEEYFDICKPADEAQVQAMTKMPVLVSFSNKHGGNADRYLHVNTYRKPDEVNSSRRNNRSNRIRLTMDEEVEAFRLFYKLMEKRGEDSYGYYYVQAQNRR